MEQRPLADGNIPPYCVESRGLPGLDKALVLPFLSPEAPSIHNIRFPEIRKMLIAAAA
jgi:hypothetical protein